MDEEDDDSMRIVVLITLVAFVHGTVELNKKKLDMV